MLYLISLGLTPSSLSPATLTILQNCVHVYIEAYTAIMHTQWEFLGKNNTQSSLTREDMEGECEWLNKAKEEDIALCVIGDVFAATTHTDLLLRARQLGIKTKIKHNASIINAIGATGLQLYNFGPPTSIPFFTDSWRPMSFYDKLKANKDRGLHTLLLLGHRFLWDSILILLDTRFLDIKVREQSIENMARGRAIYEPPRFMTVNQCVEQLLEAEEDKAEGVCSPTSLAVGVARLGYDDEVIRAGTLEELVKEDFGEPLHCMVLIGDMHFVEKEVVGGSAVDDKSWQEHTKHVKE